MLKKAYISVIIAVISSLCIPSVYAANMEYTFDYTMPSEAGWVQYRSGVNPIFTDKRKEDIYTGKIDRILTPPIFGYGMVKTSDAFSKTPYAILSNEQLKAQIEIYQEMLPIWITIKKDSAGIAREYIARKLSIGYNVNREQNFKVYIYEKELQDSFICAYKIIPKRITKKTSAVVMAALVDKDKKTIFWIRMTYEYNPEEEGRINPEDTVMKLASSLDYFPADQDKTAYALYSVDDLITEIDECQAAWTNEYWRMLYSVGQQMEVVINNQTKNIKFDRELYLHPERAKEYLDNTIEYCNQAIAQQPVSPYLYYANALMSEFGDGIKRYERSRDLAVTDSYKKAIELKPDFEGAYYNMAVFYFAKADYTNAIQYGKKALDLDSNSPLTLCFLGLVYEKSNDTENALESFNSAEKAWGDKEKKASSNTLNQLKQKIAGLEAQKRRQ